MRVPTKPSEILRGPFFLTYSGLACIYDMKKNSFEAGGPFLHGLPSPSGLLILWMRKYSPRRFISPIYIRASASTGLPLIRLIKIHSDYYLKKEEVQLRIISKTKGNPIKVSSCAWK
jgi:hypothetical protein